MTIESVAHSARGYVLKNADTTRQREVDTINEYIDKFEMLLEHCRKVPHEKSDAMYYELVARYLANSRDAKVNGKPMAVKISNTFGPPILSAMDLVPCSNVLAFTLAHSQAQRQEFLDAATEAGMRPWLCQVGSRFYWGGVAGGHLLPPNLIVGNTHCATQSVGLEQWAQYLGLPYFRLDRPMMYSEYAVQVHTKQFEKLVAWLEEQTGHRMDWDKLQENVENLKQLRAVREEIAELRKAVPHPMRSEQNKQLEFTDAYYSGSPEAVQFARQIRDQLKERVEQKKGYLEDEKLRLLSFWLPPTFAPGLLDWWEERWGAVSVLEPWFTYNSRQVELDPKKPLESLARAAYYGQWCNHFAMAGGEIIEDFVRFAKEYSADGAVCYQPGHCRPTSPMVQVLRDALKKQAHIPTLVVDVDIIDPTYVSEEEIKDKTEAFFEMLIERKEA